MLFFLTICKNVPKMRLYLSLNKLILFSDLALVCAEVQKCKAPRPTASRPTETPDNNRLDRMNSICGYHWPYMAKQGPFEILCTRANERRTASLICCLVKLLQRLLFPSITIKLLKSAMINVIHDNIGLQMSQIA